MCTLIDTAFMQVTIRRRALLLRCLSLLVLLGVVAIALPVAAADTSFRSRLQLSKQTLHLMSIHPDHILTGFFVDYNETPRPLQAEEWDDPRLAKLNKVRLHSHGAESVWLRAQCSANSAVSFEECHGSICKKLNLIPAEKTVDPHTVLLRGDWGDYTLSAAQLRHTIAQTDARQETCRLRWPAWAVRAKSLSAGNRSEVPKQLLVIQTDTELLWVDAARKTLWNRAAWPVARSGVFQSFEADESGRMLFKNQRGAALMLDFKTGQAFAYSKQTLRKPDFALASVFARNEWSSAEQSILAPEGTQNMHLLDINLAGIWWNHGFLTWKRVAQMTSLGMTPEVRRYPQGAVAASVAWSDSSGLSKTIVSFLNESKMTISTVEDDSEQFVTRQSLSDENTLKKAKSARIWADETTVALHDAQGSMQVIEESGLRTVFVTQPSARIIQLGPELFVVQSGTNKSVATCKLTHWRSHQQNKGWYTGLKSELGECSAGFARSKHSTSIVEKTPGGLSILFYAEL